MILSVALFGIFSLALVASFTVPVATPASSVANIPSPILSPPVGPDSTVSPATSVECKGDMNYDGAVDNLDIEPLLKFYEEHNEEDFWSMDINGDGFVDNRDLRAFVELLLGDEMICR